jgi:hypothetical protein
VPCTALASTDRSCQLNGGDRLDVFCGIDWAEDHVRREASEIEWRKETFASWPSQRLGEAEGSLIRESPGGWEQP